jgi:hypothetical protein
LNLGLKDKFKKGVEQLGFNIEDILEKERDAALGNGGLGRLAACYLDSSASQELPVWGYGLRYEYGIFQQLISPDGEQLEVSFCSPCSSAFQHPFRPRTRGSPTRTLGSFLGSTSLMMSGSMVTLKGSTMGLAARFGKVAKRCLQLHMMS